MTANTQGLVNQFKLDLLQGFHNFGNINPARTANTVDVFKCALYYVGSSIDTTTSNYTTVGEVSGTNYVAGGIVLSNANLPALFTQITPTVPPINSVGWQPSANLVWSNVTISTPFDTVLIYNSSQGNRAVSVHTFGSQTITAGNFSLALPSAGYGTALLNIA